MSDQNPKINVGALAFEWDEERGVFLIMGIAAVAMWIDTTMAGFMSGLHRMVGTERFRLALYGAGEEGIEGEWQHIVLSMPTVEEGLGFIGQQANKVGLGYWELVSLDREKREARFRSKNSWEALYQKALGVCWGSSSLAGRFAGYCNHIFEEHCWAEQTAFIADGAEWDEFVVRPSPRTVDSELELLMAEDKATRADLNAALERLRLEVQERKLAEERLQHEVQERTLAQQALLDKIAIIREQENAIRAMTTPILELWSGILALPIIGRVDNARAAQMMENLLQEIVKTQSRFTIIDLTGVEEIDTSAADHLLKLVRAAGLLGTRCILSGISPAMSQAIVDLGMSLAEVRAFSTLAAALRFALQQSPDKATKPT